MEQIRDYLQTQALRLDADAVAVARAAAAAVMAQGQAHIERGVLVHEAMPEGLAAQTGLLKQLFMALDSAYSRQNAETAALYGLLPGEARLVRLVQLGRPVEAQWCLDGASAEQSLACRTAQSGWANIAEDTGRWLANGDLAGGHNRRAAAQAALPVCGTDGAVYGVLHLESAAALDDAALASWTGLALALLPVLRALLPKEEDDGAA